MLRFFRQLRKEQLMSDKTRKYLLYAIGEILLVVIGILIALQVNNWNTERLDRQEEQLLLAQLRSEFISNREQIDDKVALRKKAADASLLILHAISDSGNDFTTSEIDSLIAFIIPVFTFDPQNGIHNQLVEAGKLSVVRNARLREMISNWSGILTDYREAEADYSNLSNNLLRPFLYREANYRSIINERIKNGVITQTLLSAQYEDNTMVGPSVREISADQLLRSREFENLITSTYSLLTYLNAQSLGLKNHINDIIELTEGELDN